MIKIDLNQISIYLIEIRIINIKGNKITEAWDPLKLMFLYKKYFTKWLAHLKNRFIGHFTKYFLKNRKNIIKYKKKTPAQISLTSCYLKQGKY